MSRRCPSRRPVGRKSRGYVLLATLAIVVVMTLLASSIAVTTERAIDDRQHADDRLQAEIDASSTAATVMYLLATQRMTFGGLTIDRRMVLSADEAADQKGLETPIGLRPVGNEIRLDGTPYQGLGDIRFALQDDRGLVNVNWQSREFLSRFLVTLGVKPEQIPGLFAKLKDYQDADDLYLLNGGESDAYLKAGMDPPSNRPLATPLELRKVLGWQEALAGLDDAALLARFSLSRNPLVNVNTAGPAVLQMIPGIDPANAARVLAHRQITPFSSVYEFARYTGLFLDDDQSSVLSLYPGGSGTLDVWSEKLGSLRQSHWSMTPVDDGGRPWRSQYSFVLSLPEKPDAVPAQKPRTKVFDDALPAR